MSQVNFTKAEAGWVYTFTSTGGAAAVQMNTVSGGKIWVFGSFDGMTRSLLADIDNPYASAMFSVEVPAGIQVMIVSSVEVLKAVIENDAN